MKIIVILNVLKEYVIYFSLIPLVLISTVYGLNYFIIPTKYEAKNQLLISMKKEETQNLDDLRTSIQLIGTLSSIAKSDKTTKEVSNRLGSKKINEQVSVSTNDNSLILNVEVSGTNKDQTIRVANLYGEVLSENFPTLFNGTQVTILESAENAESSSMTIQLILAGIVGELVACVYVLYLNKTSLIITNNEQINELGLIVLGNAALMKERVE